MEPSDALHTLGTFRHSFYECLHRRADALFELTDALLSADTVPSPVHLSLEASHRRGWGSLYAALDRGRIDAEALRELLARHPLAGSETTPVYAVDVSVWDRCDAESSPQRGYYYHPSRHSAGQPIVAGWAYQFVARLNFIRESWTAPVDALRVHPMEDTNMVAAEQVKALVGRLGREEAVPLFVFDAGYDPVKLQQGLEGWPCQILVRLRAGRRFYADPSLAGPPAHTGRPRRHGPKMNCKDPSTWPKPSAEHTCEDTGYGTVRVRAWANLHPKVRTHEGRGSRGPLPIARGTLVLVEVERLPRGERRREPRVLWLWWHGAGEPDLGLLWRAYVRRFDLEMTYPRCPCKRCESSLRAASAALSSFLHHRITPPRTSCGYGSRRAGFEAAATALAPAGRPTRSTALADPAPGEPLPGRAGSSRRA
jgi:DDE superfamily endonuclease